MLRLKFSKLHKLAYLSLKITKMQFYSLNVKKFSYQNQIYQNILNFPRFSHSKTAYFWEIGIDRDPGINGYQVRGNLLASTDLALTITILL